jgi:two-component system OmpR family response regulator
LSWQAAGRQHKSVGSPLPLGDSLGRIAGMKVLVVEDDAETAAYIVNGLSEHGHVVDYASNGREGLSLAGRGGYEVAIVDRMLPGLDGLSLVKALRDGGIGTAVLFLTNLGGIDDRVEGLEAGGDDYLVKPFAFSELLARVNALGRRPPMNAVETVLRVADLEINLITRGVARGGRPVDLQPREFKLLECLMRNAGKVVTRTMLLEKVWDFHFDPKTNIVETHMSRLRAKVDRGFSRELIHTVRGAGYSLRAPA